MYFMLEVSIFRAIFANCYIHVCCFIRNVLSVEKINMKLQKLYSETDITVCLFLFYKKGLGDHKSDNYGWNPI